MITLEPSAEKVEYLKKFNIETEIVIGINGKIASEEEIESRVSPLYSKIAPKGAIGCSISHMNVWSKFLETNDDYAIIFEDDIVLEENFNEKLANALFEVPRTYDIIYLGCIGCDTNNLLFGKITKKIQLTSNIAKNDFALGTHAYIVSRKGAQKLLLELDGKLNSPIDNSITKLVDDGIIESYMVTPRIAHQTSADTTTSLNVSSNYPLILTFILDKIYIDKFYNARYYFTNSFMRLGRFNLNKISVIFLIIGTVLSAKKINFKVITLWFLILSIPDIVSIRTVKDIEIILFFYFLLLLPTAISKILD